MGVSSIKYNSSSVRNYGWEFSMNSQVLRTRELFWKVDFNVGMNKSKVIKTYYKDISEVLKGYDKTTPVEGLRQMHGLGIVSGIDPIVQVIRWHL